MKIPKTCRFDIDKLVIHIDEIFPSKITIIDDVVEKILNLIETRRCWEDMQNVGLALREALANAIVHGNEYSPAKAVRVCVALAEDCNLLIVVKDAGSGFDPNELPDPVRGKNLLSTHGRGIFLINRLMDDVRFSFERGTAIYMRRSPEPQIQISRSNRGRRPAAGHGRDTSAEPADDRGNGT